MLRSDANIIADPTNKKGYGPLVFQASYYYMGATLPSPTSLPVQRQH